MPGLMDGLFALADAAGNGGLMSLKACLTLGAILFAIGAWGALARRNILIVLVSIELMLNAVNLVLASFARAHAQLSPAPAGENGHIFALFIIAVAAAEAAVGLALVIAWFRNKETVDTREMTEMKN